MLAYWLALALAVATMAAIYALLRSRTGLALAAVRDNDNAARSVGVDARRVKWVVFLTAAAMTGLVGALIYVQTARISPDAAFSVTSWTAYVIFIVVIGGIGRLEGPDPRRPRLLGPADRLCRLRQLVSPGPWPSGHRHHAVRPARACGA